MNDTEFENHLRGLLSPAAPSPELRERIREDLGTAVKKSPAYSGSLPSKQTPVSVPVETTTAAATTAPANTFEHDETTNELVAAQDSEQLVETNDGPAREVHYTYLERHAWSNPHTGARVYLEVPREDVYLLPVSLQ